MLRNDNPDARGGQLETMAVFALVFVFVGLQFQLSAALYGAIGALIIGLFIPSLGRRIESIWNKLGRGIAAINSRIILTVVFFLVLTPLAWLYRLFYADPLRLKGDRTSYYSERDHAYSRQDLEKMW